MPLDHQNDVTKTLLFNWHKPGKSYKEKKINEITS